MENKIQYIEISKLHPHPDNPRKDIGDVSELAESIKVSGILQNLTAVPATGYYYGEYTVIIGHRRLAAAKLAGLETVPCVITEMDAREQLATMLLENMQRSDLTLYEQAQGMQMMLELGETVKSIAEKTGFSQSTVRRRSRLAQLDPDAFKKTEGRQVDISDYDKIFEVKDAARRNKLLQYVGTANLNWAVNKAKAEENNEKTTKAFTATLYVKGIEPIEDPSGLKRLRFSCDIPCEVPEDAQYYRVEYNKWITFYKDYTAEELTAKKEQEERKRADETEQSNRTKQLYSLFKRAFEVRREFAKAFNAFKENTDTLCEMAASAIHKCTYSWKDEINGSIFKYVMNIPEHEEINIREYIVRKGRKQQMLFALAYSILETTDHSSCYNAVSEYKGSVDTDRIYEYLTRLGYEMSDEERALLDGTHELYLKSEVQSDE